MFYDFFLGISASFAVKMFRAWIAEKDANSVTSSLRKANLDIRLLVRQNPAGAFLECVMTLFFHPQTNSVHCCQLQIITDHR